jgi:beta-lactam-binding protein with PASTA domain
MTSASAATPTAAGTSPGTDGRRAVTAAEVDRKYRRSIVGTVTDKSSHQENYLGMMNAVAVHDLTLETPDGAIVTATLSGTVISGPVPKEHEVVEIDLGASKKRRSGEAYLTKRLFNHSRNAPVETRTSAAGTRGKGRYLYWLFGAAVVGFMAYVVGALFGLWAGPSPAPQEAGSTTHTFTVPDLKGIKSTAMEAALTHAGFRPGEYVVEQRRNEAPAGTVFATDPAAGANVSVVRAPGVAPTAVLTISLSTGPQGTDLPPDTTNSKNPGPGSSSGPTRSAPGGGDGSNSGRTDTDKVAVPDVAGLSSAEARKALERAGFAVQVAYDAQSTAPPLTAVRTSPDKGTAQGKGRTVTLYLSLAVMPNVTNGSMSLAEARQALKKAGITGRVLFGCDSSEDAIVTGQSPAGGDRVNPTAPVSLCAPAGEPVPVPPTTGTEGPPPAD